MALTIMIEKVRSLSKVVDTTKGTLQVQILLALKNSEKSMTPDYLSKLIGKRRKSISDALIKLKKKGLVIKVDKMGEATYTITEKGAKYIDELLELFNQKDQEDQIGGLAGVTDLLPLFFYTYDAITALGIAGENGLTLKHIAKIFGLSEEIAETYMDLFIEAPGAKLFNKIKSVETRYYLTEEGWRLFNQLRCYSKIKSRLLMRVLSLMTRSTHPKKIYSRLSIMLASGSLITVVATIFSGNNILCWIWFALIAFLGLLVGVDHVQTSLF